MIEKIKDILYDLTDFILILVIILVMTSVISFKVTDAMSVNIFSFISDLTTETEEATDDATDVSAGEEETSPEEIVIKPEFNPEQEDEGETNDQEKDTSESTGSESSETESTETREVTVEIKSGSTGYDIAKTLEANQLIEDTTAFINRVEDLELGAKLQSGTFTLNTAQSLDDMIYTLAGQR